MSRFPPLLLITLVLIAGCMTPAPKETPATIPATGSVEISSTPPGAEVYLDNVYKGTTPVTVIGEPGSHVLEIRLRDYQSWSKSIVVEGGAKGYVDTALVPVPVVTTATLPVTSPATLPTTRPRPTTEPITIPTTSPTTTPITVPTTTPTIKLATPVPLSPDDGQVFTGRIRWTTFTWGPVPGAAGYLLEAEYFLPSKQAWQMGIYENVVPTTYTYQLWTRMGTPGEPVNSFRWRVTAKSPDPSATSNASAWRYFTWKDA